MHLAHFYIDAMTIGFDVHKRQPHDLIGFSRKLKIPKEAIDCDSLNAIERYIRKFSKRYNFEDPGCHAALLAAINSGEKPSLELKNTTCLNWMTQYSVTRVSPVQIDSYHINILMNSDMIGLLVNLDVVATVTTKFVRRKYD